MGLFDRLRGDDLSRVALIGIDGVPYSLLSAHFDEFEHLGEIARAGEAGPIESIVPPDSSACWPSLTTGQNPGKTGVYGLMDREVGSYDTYIPMGNDVQAERVWDRVQAANRQATVLNVPVTFPPQRTVQRMVSGFLSTDRDKAAHPESVANYLDSIDYRVDVDATLGHSSDTEAFLEDAHETLETRFEAFTHFIEENDWDLFCGVFMTPDRVNHFLFDQYVDEGEEYEAFMEFYRTLDEYIGKIRAKLPDNVTLIVVSDHGFTKLDYEVNCNQWLQNEGWLSFGEQADYVVQLNYLLREIGLLSYDPVEHGDASETDETDGSAASSAGSDSAREQPPLEIERLDAIEAADFDGPDDDPELVFDETEITDGSQAIAPDPGTVLVFDDEAVESVRSTLSGLTSDEGTPLIESIDTVEPPERVAAKFDLIPSAGTRFGVDHSLSGDPVAHAHDSLADITDDTRAYSLIPGRFYLNLEDREPRGSVPESEYESVRDDLRADLNALEGPDGRPVCKRIIDAEDAFRGKHDELAPDLVVIPHDGFDLKAGFTPGKDVFTKGPRTGMHTFDDACLFIDDDDARISDSDLLDLAPTILTLLDIEYDRTDFDGASLI